MKGRGGEGGEEGKGGHYNWLPEHFDVRNTSTIFVQ